MSSRYLSGVTEYAIRPVGWWERSGLEIKTLWFHQDSNKRVNVFPGRSPLLHVTTLTLKVRTLFNFRLINK